MREGNLSSGKIYLDVVKIWKSILSMSRREQDDGCLIRFFSLSGPVAIAGWLALIASPWLPSWLPKGFAEHSSFRPCCRSPTPGLILAFWSSAEGGFDTLDNVALLFESARNAAGRLAALSRLRSLFVGAWIVRTARTEGISFWLVLPCLPLTFLFGPAGYLAFVSLRTVLPGRRLFEPA
jgi:hypothetical protein